KKEKSFWGSFSEEDKKKIESRYQKIKKEYITLQNLRKAQELTQERMAEILNVRQENISRLEKRTDMMLSTLRSYIQAMGGDLKLVVEFPNHEPVVLTGLNSIQ
ncbi:MAG: XRE family transcriptional regulator, partial [Rickettsiales bacterium]